MAPGYKPRPMYAQVPGSRTILVQSVTVDGWRFIEDPEHGDKLFHLEVDPHEKENVVNEYPQRAATLKKQLHQIVVNQKTLARRNKAGRLIPMSSERQAALQDLGYIGEDAEDEDDAASHTSAETATGDRPGSSTKTTDNKPGKRNKRKKKGGR